MSHVTEPLGLCILCMFWKMRLELLALPELQRLTLLAKDSLQKYLMQSNSSTPFDASVTRFTQSGKNQASQAAKLEFAAVKTRKPAARRTVGFLLWLRHFLLEMQTSFSFCMCFFMFFFLMFHL